MKWLKVVGKKEPWPLMFGGFATGFLLTLPGIRPVLAPLQIVALVPALLALRRVESWGQCVALGIRIGLAYMAPQAVVLRLPPLMSLTLIVYFLLLFIVLAVVAWRILAFRDVWGCLAFGAFLAVLDWVGFTLMPMWGTAQSLARAWSWYPQAIAFTSVTGITGVIFVLGTIQCLGVIITYERRQRVPGVLALIVILGAVAVVDGLVAGEQPVGHMKVGAVGWLHPRAEGRTGALYEKYLADAAGQGVQLFVSPETAFGVDSDDGPEALTQFRNLARRYGVCLAAGYFDARSSENRVAFIGPAEGIMGRYTKTHLTPFEDYTKGKGQPTIVQVGGIPIGAMICQDDNYTDISRRYGVVPAGIVAVPTNDWITVRSAHLQNTIHRAIESRFAIVRAASNGISAIISPKGQVLATKDHFTDGPGLIVGDVPVYQHRTIFSRYGHWFVAACGVFLASYRVGRKGSPGQRHDNRGGV